MGTRLVGVRWACGQWARTPLDLLSEWLWGQDGDLGSCSTTQVGRPLSEPQHCYLSGGPADGTWHSESIRDVCREPGTEPGTEELWVSAGPQS